MNPATDPNRPPLCEVMQDACADHPRGVVDLHSAAVAAELESAQPTTLYRRTHD